MTFVHYAIRSHLSCSSQQAWAHAASVQGIMAEFAPVLRMTFPPEITELDEHTVPLGRTLCRSWLLLGGVLPIEYDDVTIVELEPGVRFLERSSMLTQRTWVHERVVAPTTGGCQLTDRLSAEPRIPVPERVVHVIVRSIFQHRHRRLRELLGGSHSVER